MTDDAPLICFTDVAGANVRLAEGGGFVSLAQLADPECCGVWSDALCVSSAHEAMVIVFDLAMRGTFLFPINRRLLEAMVKASGR